MSALDTSLAALIDAHNLTSCSLSMLAACDQHDAFYSMSIQWRDSFGALDGVIEHGKTSSEALQTALAAMMAKRAVALVGELA